MGERGRGWEEPNSRLGVMSGWPRHLVFTHWVIQCLGNTYCRPQTVLDDRLSSGQDTRDLLSQC